MAHKRWIELHARIEGEQAHHAHSDSQPAPPFDLSRQSAQPEEEIERRVSPERARDGRERRLRQVRAECPAARDDRRQIAGHEPQRTPERNPGEVCEQPGDAERGGHTAATSGTPRRSRVSGASTRSASSVARSARLTIHRSAIVTSRPRIADRIEPERERQAQYANELAQHRCALRGKYRVALNFLGMPPETNYASRSADVSSPRRRSATAFWSRHLSAWPRCQRIVATSSENGPDNALRGSQAVVRSRNLAAECAASRTNIQEQGDRHDRAQRAVAAHPVRRRVLLHRQFHHSHDAALAQERIPAAAR